MVGTADAANHLFLGREAKYIGEPDVNEPGVKDATVSDFLLPYLLGPGVKAGAEGVLPALEDLGETGAVSLGRAAPKMEEAAEAGAPKIEAFVKGIQKGPSGDVKIWGVKGPPELLKQHFGDEAPGSVPEDVLRAKGILPEQVNIPGKMAPNAYAEGGKVERSSLEHPEPNAMMARAMNEGGKVNYPHVTFLENVSTPEMKKTVHLEDPSGAHGKKIATGHEENYAEGGTVHKAEDRNKEPAKPANIEMSHEDKLKSIYKTLGMKKYADGGPVLPNAPALNPNAPPSQTDPSYWDQIKAALSQVTAPAGAMAAPLAGLVEKGAPLAPAAVSAVNTLTGASLPVPASPAPVGANVGVPAASPAPVLPTPAPLPPAMPPAAVAGSTPKAPDLTNLFNQDTSSLEKGSTAEDRNALVGKLQAQQHGLGPIIAQAVAGLGDALTAKGGREQHSLQGIFSMQKEQRDEALANFDKARQDRLQKLDIQTKLGQNAIAKLAAQDAYGVDESVNKMVGAPPGTAHKDLPLYMQMKAAQVAAQEKDADLYMKSHAQAGTDIDNAVKNASILSIKPSSAQLQASGAKLADQYYNKAKGNILFQPSDGQKAVWIPAANIGKARQMDPHGQIVP